MQSHRIAVMLESNVICTLNPSRSHLPATRRANKRNGLYDRDLIKSQIGSAIIRRADAHANLTMTGWWD